MLPMALVANHASLQICGLAKFHIVFYSLAWKKCSVFYGFNARRQHFMQYSMVSTSCGVALGVLARIYFAFHFSISTIQVYVMTNELIITCS